jgi:hypothetical protein
MKAREQDFEGKFQPDVSIHEYRLLGLPFLFGSDRLVACMKTST